MSCPCVALPKKDSIDNELDRTWNKEMRSLLQDMIHFCNGCQPFLEPEPVKISELEKRYLGRYWKQSERNMETFQQTSITGMGITFISENGEIYGQNLMFLHDLPRVPATNNEAERRLRSYKRKQAQAVTFRSFESIDYLCQCMSMFCFDAAGRTSE